MKKETHSVSVRNTCRNVRDRKPKTETRNPELGNWAKKGSQTPNESESPYLFCIYFFLKKK